MSQQYLVYNGPMQTTAAPTPVTTGTSLKTMLQINPLEPLDIVEWGIMFDGSPASIQAELIETDVGATVTAYVSGDATRQGPSVLDAVSGSMFLTYGTGASGYTSSGTGTEGAITSVRNLDGPLILSTNSFVKQFPLGREPLLQLGKFLRIRVKAASAVNCLCYVVLGRR